MAFHYYSLCLLLLFSISINAEPEECRTYIILLDNSQKPSAFLSHESWHRSLMSDNKETLLYSYKHITHGFSARLTSSQLSEIEKSPAHVATYPESFGRLFTTYSPKFLGLQHNSGIWPNSSYGEGVIIGIFDTGIWPESESFSEQGMPAIPSRWKGECESGTEFNRSLCNRKLIGARSFNKGTLAEGYNISRENDYDSPRDFLGHGTHIASTAAGNYVDGASYFGYGKGTAQGMAPRAHVAMYKIGWKADVGENVAASDVLAAMDQAVADGVDVMSLSLGFDHAPYFEDLIAIASFSAIEKGIFVACGAGNDFRRNTTYNGAPWITTVGAASLDRTFIGRLTLDNEVTLEGISYYPLNVYIKNVSLYYGKENASKALCDYTALDQKEVAGKVVLCDKSEKPEALLNQITAVERAGGYAAILQDNAPDLNPNDYTFPTLILQTKDGSLVKKYATEVSKANVKSMRFLLNKFGSSSAPQVASFSSRGFDPINPGMLKPDIVAPGVDVLAAVTPNVPKVEIGKYNLVSDYALYSGTSMATPHVAGAAALLRAVHKDWSSAAIRSALMTTAYSMDKTGSTLRDQSTGLPATPLDFGAGHIDPNKAMDPGLIYDIDFQNYVDFLCGLRYNEKQMRSVLRRNEWKCSEGSSQLNYPSFVATMTDGAVMNLSRVVTNVGEKDAVYQAKLKFPTGVKVSIEPSTLTFTEKNQKRSFILSIGIGKEAPSMVYGFLGWIDQYNHKVSSPVVVIK